MSIKIFIILSIIYFILGIGSITKFKYKNASLIWFIYLTVLLPISNITIPFHIRYQIAIYYFFFVGVLVINFKRIILKKRVNPKLVIGIASVLFVFSIFCLHYLVFVTETRDTTNILKDIKPFFIIILAYLFVDYYKNDLKTILTKVFCIRLLTFNFIISTGLFYLFYKYNLHLVLTDDKYFRYEEIRYETLGTYFGIFYLLHSIFSKKKVSLKEIFLVLLPTFYSGNRTLIISVLIVLSIYFLSVASLKRILVFLLSIITLSSSFVFFVTRAGEDSPLYRFQNLINIEYISDNLLTRFSPFVNTIQSFSFVDFIIGKGFGHTFYIPWFAWRDNIDNYNVYIDNLYLTLYTKYGILFITIFIILYYFLKMFSDRHVYTYFFLFILVVSITNSMVYQYNFLWFLVVFSFPFNSLSNIKKFE